MLKIFIVEDETPVRERIRDIINNFQEEFIYCGEASDGELAYPIICEIKPDIVITDIKMPLVDGLELSKLIKQSMPWIKIIIISAYEDFEYAKEALSIGVEEYLIKPLTSHEIISTLWKVKEKIENERRLTINLHYLEKELNENKNVLEKRFFNKLLMGSFKTSDLLIEASNLNFNIVAKYYGIISMEYYPQKPEYDTYDEFLKLQEMINRLLELNNENVLTYKKSESEIIIILKSNDKKVLEEKLYSLAETLQYEIERSTIYKTYIGISSICERLSEIPEAYKESQKSKSISLIFPDIKIKDSCDSNSLFESHEDIEKIHNIEIDALIKFNDLSKLNEIVDEITKLYVEFKSKSFLLVYYLYLKVAIKCFNILSEYSSEVRIINKIINHLFSVSDATTDRFRIIIKELLETTINAKLQLFTKKYDSTIKKVKEIIEKEYNNPSLSLSTVAEKVNMSMSHLSFIFKQETGQTFIEYLTNIRLNKAKELLISSSLKVTEIATMVGYNEPHYFSYLFKRKTGLSPQEFRNKNSVGGIHEE
ncbi:response regulator [Caldicellulosiruptor acetigenus]|uniref:response regulator n=1 Tax=Caldicellulosiruptor acetigenus TaxID=301953 RepID=UPI0004081720|nr:response regulator [Caldicellulosiruptor acetigenus]WAM36047.1 response regulator [Caldicellulosiruptor acetigenus]